MSQPGNGDVTVILTAMTDAERDFLPLAVESVRRQTLRCRTVLCIAEDNDWVGGLQLGGDFTVLRRALAPPGVVRNAALAHCDTKWIAFLDADDIWEPTKLERQVPVAEAEDMRIVGCDYMFIDDEGRVFGYDMGRFFPMPSTWLIDRRLLVEQPFTDHIRGSDGEWWHRTLKLGIPRRRIPEFLVRYRVREGALSTKTRKEMLKRLSKWPLMRPPLRLGTRVLHRIHRSTTYRTDPRWDLEGDWVL